MKLYHISRELNKDIKEFIPKVRDSSLGFGEDREIARICLSDELEKCLGAISYILDKDVYDGETDRFKVVKVYEFDIDDNDVIPPEKTHKYVPDALLTHEYWYVKGNLKPSRTFFIRPTYYIRGKYVNMLDYLEYELTDINGEILE